MGKPSYIRRKDFKKNPKLNIAIIINHVPIFSGFWKFEIVSQEFTLSKCMVSSFIDLDFSSSSCNVRGYAHPD